MTKNVFVGHALPEPPNVFSQSKTNEPILNPDSPFQHASWSFVEYPDGTMYEGSWLQGSPDAHGICYYISGDIFVGQFNKGIINGEGTVFFQFGDFFTGEFRDGSIHRGLYGRNGHEVWGLWEGDRCIEEHPVTVLETFQKKHASLFSVLLQRVHHHLSHYKIQSMHSTGVIRSCSNLKPPQPILPIAQLSESRFPWVNSFTLKGFSSSHTKAHNECSNNALDGGVWKNGAPSTPGLLIYKDSFHRKTNEHDSENGRENDIDGKISGVMLQPLLPNVIFACSAPACNEYFSFLRYQLRCFLFLFPFLSLHWSPFAPLRVSTVDQEREFVVSGATLRRDFDSMNLTINCIAVAVCCQVAAIAIAACRIHVGYVSEGSISLIEMSVPCILWVVLAMFCAGYNSYFRYPHFLERMNRQVTPKLSAFAASMVDARAKVCISTWDEEGRGKVMNRHYLYRWLFFSVLSGLIFSLAAPVIRVAYGHSLFGSGFLMCALLLSSIATLLFTTTLLYYVFKITDTQREIAAKLRVLSDLAYIEKRAIIRPSVYLRQTFDMSARLNTDDLLNGFTGWYAARSLILYGSSYSNHLSRSAAMSIFVTVLAILGIAGILSGVNVFLSSSKNTPNHYVMAHSYGVLLFFIWGIQLIRYINASACTQRELEHHQYIMNLTSMYHRVKYRDVEASEIIKHSCEMAASHDLKPRWFNFPMYPISMFFLILLNAFAFFSSIFTLIREIQ